MESGDYEQRGVDGIWRTLEGVVAGLKEKYGQPPYKVTWDAPVAAEYDPRGWRVRGHFEMVPNYSVGHVQDYDITEWELGE